MLLCQQRSMAEWLNRLTKAVYSMNIRYHPIGTGFDSRSVLTINIVSSYNKLNMFYVQSVEEIDERRK